MADYSQIELRLLAHMSDDPVLVDAFSRGEDIHTRTAAEGFRVPPLMVTSDMRRNAKAMNFGIVYGQTPFGLAASLGIDRKEAELYIQTYFELTGREEVHSEDDRGGARERVRADAVRPQAPDPGHAQPQSERAIVCGANGREYAIAGHGGGLD